MDEDSVKKLLVVGDSFMKSDPGFLGQHWSEMLPEYKILMYAQSGSTNGMIAWQFFEGLQQNPDAIVLGFTMPDRIEFKLDDVQQKHHNRIWSSNGHQNLTSDQKLTVASYQATACQEMMLFKGFLTVRSLLLTCEKQKIPYAFTLNGLWDSATKCLIDEPWKTIYKHEIMTLGEFAKHLIPTNFASSGIFKTRPGFHVDDPAWQQRFAQEAREILQLPIDNTIQIV
jgi:hypothetical protein